MHGHGLAREGAAQDIEILVEMFPLGGARHAKALELVGDIARPHAQDQPALREDIDHGVILRHPQGMVKWQHADRHAQADPIGPLRRRSQKNGRVRHRAVFMEVMLRQPEALVSQLFRQNHVIQGLVVVSSHATVFFRVVVVNREHRITHNLLPHYPAIRP